MSKRMFCHDRAPIRLQTTSAQKGVFFIRDLNYGVIDGAPAKNYNLLIIFFWKIFC